MQSFFFFNYLVIHFSKQDKVRNKLEQSCLGRSLTEAGVGDTSFIRNALRQTKVGRLDRTACLSLQQNTWVFLLNRSDKDGLMVRFIPLSA